MNRPLDIVSTASFKNINVGSYQGDVDGSLACNRHSNVSSSAAVGSGLGVGDGVGVSVGSGVQAIAIRNVTRSNGNNMRIHPLDSKPLLFILSLM